MTTDKDIKRFREVAMASLELSEALGEFFRGKDLSGLADKLTKNDIGLLKKLIVSRVEILNSFELLCRFSPEDAVEVLIRRYIGVGVSPYGKFGGFRFELSAMLDDYREICGDQALRRLIIHHDFDKKKLEDPQVLKSLAEVLEIDDIRQVEVWCREIEAEQKNTADT